MISGKLAPNSRWMASCCHTRRKTHPHPTHGTVGRDLPDDVAQGNATAIGQKIGSDLLFGRVTGKQLDKALQYLQGENASEIRPLGDAQKMVNEDQGGHNWQTSVASWNIKTANECSRTAMEIATRAMHA